MSLTATDIAALDALQAAGDRSGYYDYLAGTGDRYGTLAGDVVQGDSVQGRLASAFLVKRAAEQGVNLSDAQVTAVSVRLMELDFIARENAFLNGDTGELTWDVISGYHETAFGQFGMTNDVWTADAVLDVVGRNYQRFGFDSADEAQAFVWDSMLSENIIVHAGIFEHMGSYGKPWGLGLDFEVYPIDEQARAWTQAVSEVVTEENLSLLAAAFGIGYTEECFAAGTPVDMWPVGLALKPNTDGIYDQDAVRAGIWTKPIEEVNDTDTVVSFDKQGNLVPGNVTRTMTNNAKIILDFHGTFVTPGHVYWCAGGKYEGKYAPLIDILRDDGVIQHQDGTLIRASTGCEVGTPDDEEFHVFKLYKDEQGNERVRDKTKLRYGTRWMMENGQHCTMREYMEGIGVEILQDGPQRGYARWKETGMTTLFAWVLSDTLPQPEDFVLARSATSLEDIYKAGQWEFMQPTMPPPMVMDGGPVQPLSERKLEMMPRNEPMAFSSAAPSSEMLPDRNPQMNRRQRKAAEAKARRTAKNKRPKGATLH